MTIWSLSSLGCEPTGILDSFGHFIKNSLSFLTFGVYFGGCGVSGFFCSGCLSGSVGINLSGRYSKGSKDGKLTTGYSSFGLSIISKVVGYCYHVLVLGI